MIRFGIIGTNFITDSLLEASRSCPEFELTAVYSRSLDRAREFADKYGAQLVFDDLEAFAACDRIDAVYVASPNCCHAPQSILLMEHGKHVLCEKPTASNSRELEEMIAAARKNNVVLLEAMRPLHTPAFGILKESLKKLGTIRRVSFDFSKYSSRYDKYKKGIIENAFNPDLSNCALLDLGVYCVAPLIALFGMPEKIITDSIILPNGMEGAGTVMAHYPGMQALLTYSKINDSVLPNEIEGEEGNLVLDKISTPLDITIQYRNGETQKPEIPQVSNNMCYELQTFIDLVKEGKTKHQWTDISVMEMALMDEVRRQQGIVFPADKQ